ncbi:MAG: DUF5652 family protein [Candidatus Peribacteraceae bacterium]|nr:DUF5652 family protein [Candidatus Peribacteraceae bacterium]
MTYSDMLPFVGMPHWIGLLLPMMVPLIVLDIVLRGIALWRSARSNQLAWFIALLIVNSIGILPAIYLLFFDEEKKIRRSAGRRDKQKPRTSV